MFKTDWLKVLIYFFISIALLGIVTLELAYLNNLVLLGKQLALVTGYAIAITIILMFRYFLNAEAITNLRTFKMHIILFFLTTIAIDYFIIATLKLLANNPVFSFYHVKSGFLVTVFTFIIGLVCSYLIHKPVLLKKKLK